MSTDFHLYRTDVASQWRQIAEWVQSNPSCLQLALGNIQRWLTRGRLHPAPLMEWQRRIHDALGTPEGMRQLISFLCADNADAEPLKSCSPFVGICTSTLPA